MPRVVQVMVQVGVDVKVVVGDLSEERVACRLSASWCAKQTAPWALCGRAQSGSLLAY